MFMIRQKYDSNYDMAVELTGVLTETSGQLWKLKEYEHGDHAPLKVVWEREDGVWSITAEDGKLDWLVKYNDKDVVAGIYVPPVVSISEEDAYLDVVKSLMMCALFIQIGSSSIVAPRFFAAVRSGHGLEVLAKMIFGFMSDLMVKSGICVNGPS